ncbi:MAG: NAD-dependent epimerase/dehydratase family protein [Candidatus Hodarchaeota archaeon]
MKVGIVGAGEIAQFHIPYTKENSGVDVVAVCDIDEMKAKKIAEKFSIPKVYNDFSYMLGKSSLDVIHILTPPKSHANLAIQAMDSGCHVLVEKPMALTVEDAKRMVRTSRERKVKLSVCHMYHFDPTVIKMRELVRSGRMGEIIYLESYWFTDISSGGSDAYTFRGGNAAWAYGLPGNVFANFLDHPIYLQREFLREIKSISLSTDKLGDNPFVPYDEIRIYFEGVDSNGTIVSSLNIKPRLNLLRIYGTKMIATADMSNMAFSTHPTKNLPHMFSKAYINFNQSYQLMSDTVKNSSNILLGKIKVRQGLRTFIKKFYESLLLNTEPPVSREEGLENVAILSEIWNRVEAKTKGQKSTVDYGSDRAPGCFEEKPNQVRSVGQPNRKRKKTILVTGATGFLGGHLVDKLLERNCEVRVLIRRIDKRLTGNPKIQTVYGDIRDINSLRKAIQGIDVVYHLAGKVTNRGKWRDFQETIIDATRNLLDLSREAGVNRFVYISSVVVYGFKKINGRNVITETDPYGSDLGTYYYYAKSKIETDRMVLDYFNSYGLPTTVIRPGILYGPRGKNIFRNKRFIIGKGNAVLPYTYIENLVDALIPATTKEEAIGKAYNIVDDGNLTQKQFLEKTIKTSNSKLKSIFVPMEVTYLIALFFGYLAKRRKSEISPPISMFVVDSMRRNLIYDTTKAKKELGWYPKIHLEEGLERTFRWFSRSHHLD